jgi:hypothetical protein
MMNVLPMEKMIRMWRFPDAPAKLRALHPKGKKASWVMQAPPTMVEAAENFMAERGDLKGRLTRYTLADGTVVFFGDLSGITPGDRGLAR